jgi:hypothetical protein
VIAIYIRVPARHPRLTLAALDDNRGESVLHDAVIPSGRDAMWSPLRDPPSCEWRYTSAAVEHRHRLGRAAALTRALELEVGVGEEEDDGRR